MPAKPKFDFMKMVKSKRKGIGPSENVKKEMISGKGKFKGKK